MTMISRSTTNNPNPGLKEKPGQQGQGNLAWLSGLGEEDGVRLDENGIILWGGSSLADFRVRIAQSRARNDMLPSFWSGCGILLGGGKFASVPLDLKPDPSDPAGRDPISAVPSRNAVRMCSLEAYDSPEWYPNVAVIRFAEKHADVHDHIARLQSDRSIIDLAALILPWLGYVWGISGSDNPLAKGLGLPSAAFVETVFAMAGFELTPGLASASSCPEAIWQSAKWWTDFYDAITADPSTSAKAVAMTPKGYFVVRQSSAVVKSDSP